MASRIGILGGSFDPVHVGHLRIAEEARVALELERVTFVPTGFQWMKEGAEVASAADRLEMVRLATEGNDRFDVSDAEIQRPGPSYTVDTVQAAHDEMGPGTEIYFILGQDAFAELPQWSRPTELIGLCRLAVMPRVEGPDVDLDDLETRVRGVSERTTMLRDAPRIDVSSSELRGRLERGESVRGLLPEAVEAYIARRGLYRGVEVTGPRAT